MDRFLSTRARRIVYALLTTSLLVRLLSLGAYPLADTTEARYGEIARKMVELGDWITPWFDWNMPFWGKPPLAFWLSAGAMKLLGVNEFAARLPSFLLGLWMLVLVFVVLRRERGSDTALLAALVLSTTLMFFVGSGAVMTDTALALAVTLAMVSFWRALHATGRPATAWGYVFFVALAFGVLAKGPVALALVGLPVVVWCALTESWRLARSRLPWRTGVVLTLAISLPWFVLAERKTPGFISYFLIGENFLRFTDGAWRGDLYGNVHTHAYGYIWPLFLFATLPWTPWLLWRLAHSMRDLRTRSIRWPIVRELARCHAWPSFVILWLLAPCVLFTFAGSVLVTYVLPAMPALALLVSDSIVIRRPGAKGLHNPRAIFAVALLVPLAAPVAVVYFNRVIAPDRSDSALLSIIGSEASPLRVGYLPSRSFSAQFYTQGRAIQANDIEALRRLLFENRIDYVVTTNEIAIPPDLAQTLRPTAIAGNRNRRMLWTVVRTTETKLAARRETGRQAGRAGQ